jgi:hypothetical protein
MTWGRRRLAAAVAALVLLVGCSQGGAARRPAPAPDQTAGGVEAARDFRSVRAYQGTPLPVRLQPKIGVASPLDRLGRAPDGTIQEPSRGGVAGWYQLGPRPGDPARR